MSKYLAPNQAVSRKLNHNKKNILLGEVLTFRINLRFNLQGKKQDTNENKGTGMEG